MQVPVGRLRVRTNPPEHTSRTLGAPAVPESAFARKCLEGMTEVSDGETLFFNVQTPGITFAVWWPWGRGAL